MAQGKPDIARRKLAVARGVGLEQVNCCIKAIKGSVNKDYVEIGDWPARTSLYMLSAHAIRTSRVKTPLQLRWYENNAPHDETNALAECRR